MIKRIGIVANGPEAYIPDLSLYSGKVDSWIGADRGAYVIARHQLPLKYAIGDFDSTSIEEQRLIEKTAAHTEKHPSEKDETDMELAIRIAIEANAQELYLFGLTGGRMDHTLINVQQLILLKEQGIKGHIIDKQNEIELFTPGEYFLYQTEYAYYSFIPFSNTVEELTLKGFRYSLEKATLKWGSTRCISNFLNDDVASFSFQKGFLLLVKSSDR